MSGPTTRCTRTSGTSRRSTWSGRGTSSRRRPRGHRRGARHRRGVRDRDLPLQLALRVPARRRAGRSTRRSAWSTCPSPRRRSSARLDASSSPRDFIWDDNDCRSISTATARTSPGTIGQLTNNGIGVAGMAFNVRLMPVKVIAETWDFIFGAPERRHRRRRGARHPLRGGQRRQGHQHEPRPRRRRARAGGRRRDPLRGVGRGAFVAVAVRQHRARPATSRT